MVRLTSTKRKLGNLRCELQHALNFVAQKTLEDEGVSGNQIIKGAKVHKRYLPELLNELTDLGLVENKGTQARPSYFATEKGIETADTSQEKP